MALQRGRQRAPHQDRASHRSPPALHGGALFLRICFVVRLSSAGSARLDVALLALVVLLLCNSVVVVVVDVLSVRPASARARRQLGHVRTGPRRFGAALERRGVRGHLCHGPGRIRISPDVAPPKPEKGLRALLKMQVIPVTMFAACSSPCHARLFATSRPGGLAAAWPRGVAWPRRRKTPERGIFLLVAHPTHPIGRKFWVADSISAAVVTGSRRADRNLHSAALAAPPPGQ